MKKAVFALAGIAAESLAWMAALFLCSEFFEQAVRGWLGDRYFETYGRAAHPGSGLVFRRLFPPDHRLRRAGQSADEAEKRRDCGASRGGQLSVAGRHGFRLRAAERVCDIRMLQPSDSPQSGG